MNAEQARIQATRDRAAQTARVKDAEQAARQNGNSSSGRSA